MTTETIQKVVNVKANSYEFGKSGDRFKLYFENPEDLKQQIESLASIGLLDESNNPLNKEEVNQEV